MIRTSTSSSIFASRLALPGMAYAVCVGAIILLSAAFGPRPFILAQSATATLSGMVEDQTGAVIPGAIVTAINVSTNSRRQATTNDSGGFSIPLLPPSTYLVRVERDGFAPVEVKDVVLNVGDQKTLQIQLKAGSVSTSVEITAEAPLINESPAVGTIVDHQFVENIPLNGRSFQTLILLTPGVVAAKANFAEQGQFSINGQRTDSNYFSVDGVSANFSINAGGGTGQAGAGQLPALGVTGGFNSLVSIDALQEFRIQTSTYAPEYGRTPGGQVSLVTRSGSNDFHGSAFDYLRNDVLDANDFFANRRGLPKPKERQNDFGGVFGGPVSIPGIYDGRNRTFFFFSYEGLRLRLPLVATTTVPSLSLRQSAAPAVKPLLAVFPIPNGPDVGNGLAQFTAGYSDPTSMNSFGLRVDHAFSNKWTVFSRYNYSWSETAQRNSSAMLANPRLTLFNTRTLTLGATWVPTSSTTNEFRANWSRQFGGTFLVLDRFGGAVPINESVLPPFSNSLNTFFSVSVINPALARFIFGRNGEGTQGQLNFVDNFSLVRGNHQMRFGVDYRYLFPSAYSRNYDLNYTFASVADVGTGRATISRAGRRSPVDYSYRNFSAFAQDTWRATSRLTLTFGLRWEINPPPEGRNGLVLYAATQTDNPATLDFAPPGTPLWETTYGNFAPRVGVAYRLTESGSTLLRGGFGVFYDLPAGAISNVVILSPNVVSAPNIVATYPADPATIPIPPLTTAGPFANVMVADRRQELPYTLQWNVAVEQALGSKQVATISYVAAAGRRLLRQERFFNVSPNFPILQINRNSATSDYHALQLQFQRRLSRGFQALGSYTWSHSIDTASNDSSALPGTTKINLDQERGPSDFDVRHTFSGAITYDLPMPQMNRFAGAVLRQWSIDAIFTARSATPVDVVVTRDLGFGSFAFRPDLVLGVPLYIDDPNAPGGRRFNNTPVAGVPRQVGAFLVSTELRQGSLGRNSLRGFPSNQLNFALRRQFNMTERLNLQFRAEFFNIFNHPNFADPIGSIGSVSGATFVPNTSTFGQSQSMLNQSLGTGGQTGGFSPLYQVGGPRSIQFSLKLAF